MRKLLGCGSAPKEAPTAAPRALQVEGRMPVPEVVATGFIEALRREYINEVANSVGTFFETSHLPSNRQTALDPFEERIRRASNKAQAIDRLAEEWGLRTVPAAVALAAGGAAAGAAPAAGGPSLLPPIAENKVDHLERIAAISHALGLPPTANTPEVVVCGLKAHDLEVVRISLSVARHAGLTGSAEVCSAESRLRAERKLPKDWDISAYASGRFLGGGSGGREASGVVAFQKQPGHVVKEMQSLFDATYRKVYTRDRRGAPIPDRFKILEVHRVMNDQVWREYACRREDVRARLAGARPQVPDGGTHTMKYLATKPGGIDAAALPELDPKVNEAWLFHGTTREAAEGIAENDFRLDLTGSNAGTLYGKGIYLAENATKSDEYGEGTKGPTGEEAVLGFEEPRPPRGPPPALVRESHILLCRSILGKVNYTDDLRPDPDRLQKSCLIGQFDSVLGDRLKRNGTFRELIVYNDDHVYPEYIVRYERIFFHERFAKIYARMLHRRKVGKFDGPTSEEKEVLESMWNVYGMPNKGRINKWQLLDLLTAINQRPQNEGEDLDATFAEWDTKNDNWIDRDEFMQEMIQRVNDGIGL